jgi:hypothetical protein
MHGHSLCIYYLITVETVSLNSSYVLLWWMCSTSSDCMSPDSSCALLGVVVYHWIVVVY